MKQKDASHPCTSTAWGHSNSYKANLDGGKGVIQNDNRDASTFSLEGAEDREQDTPSSSTPDGRWVITSN